MNMRKTDSISYKTLYIILTSVLGILLTITGYFISDWKVSIDKKANACTDLEKRIIPIETLMPEINNSLKEIKRELKRHMENK